MTTVVITGRLSGEEGQGGVAWASLQYLIGFERLGCRVLFIEPLEGTRQVATRVYFRDVVHHFGLRGRACLWPADSGPIGMNAHEVMTAINDASVLIDLSGTARSLWEVLSSIRHRIYVDMDPVFTQIWHEQGIDVGIRDHSDFLSVGFLEGADRVPDCGLDWRPHLPPVVLDEWPTVSRAPRFGFTTVANWRSYGSVAMQGRSLGQKAHSIRGFSGLPRKTSETLSMALSIHPGDDRDRDLLESLGWELLDPADVARTPQQYKDFVRRSKAEIGFAKHGYVASRSGWFSDRSACYLASGRPVLAQETGIGNRLAVGSGLLTFSNFDEAVHGIEAISADYARHQRAARAVAERYLDSAKVLGKILSRLEAKVPG